MFGHDTGKSSAGESLWGTIGFGAVVLNCTRRNSTFYRDFSDTGQSLSRSDSALSLDLRAKASLLNFSYQDVAMDGQGAIPSEDWRRSAYAVNFASNRNNWLMRLGYQDEQLFFRQGTQFEPHNVSYGLTIAPPLSDGSTLEANAFFTQTSLDNVSGEPQCLNVTVEGSHDFPAKLTVSGKLFYEELSNSITENSYADIDTGGQLEADYRGLRHAVISFGSAIHRVGYINEQKTERVNAIQNNAFAKFSYRPSKQIKIKAYTAYDWTDNRPLAFDTFTQKSNSFVWSDKRDQGVELSYTPSYRAGITAKWRKTAWNNTDFTTHNSVVNHDISAWWIPEEKTTIYGSYLAQNFLLDIPTIDANNSHSKTFVSGFSYQWSKPLSIDLAYNVTNVNGVTDQRLHYLTLGANYRTKSGDRLSCSMAFDSLDNNITSDLNYDVNRFQIQYSKSLY